MRSPAAPAVLALGLLPAVAVPARSADAAVVRPVLAALRARAATGEARTQYELGIALLCGTQVPRDPIEAAQWVALAAGQGHAGAQSVLGWMYMTGTGVAHDHARAEHWLSVAAANGATDAARNLTQLRKGGGDPGASRAAPSPLWYAALGSTDCGPQPRALPR